MGVPLTIPGPATLGSKAAEVTRWLKGDLRRPDGQAQIRDAINDAIASIWESMMQFQLARFVGSDAPVNFTLNSGAERMQFVSVADPTAPFGLVAGQPAPGNPLPTRQYNLAYTYVTESGSETNLSPVTVNTTPNGFLAAIQYVGPPPGGGAIGWNLYAGLNLMGLQNKQPIPFAPFISEGGPAPGVPIYYVEPAAGFQDAPATQIPPTSNTTYDNLAYILHLESILPDGTKLAWNQTDLDSAKMRSMAAIFPTASVYQNYAWDLINGNTIEIRPAAGMTLTPRYWYVAKPRRIRYDSFPIPYLQISGVDEFVRNYALALCKLSLDEYLAHQAWTGLAEQKRNSILLALNQENWGKNTRVTPYLL